MCYSDNQETYFRQLYDQYYSNIYAYCYKRLSGNHDIACDCTQNTFFAAFKNIGVLRKHDNVGGWLFKTANNYVQQAFRQIKWEQNTISLTVLNRDMPSPTNFVSQLETKETLRDILGTLSDDDRTLHRLFYIDGQNTTQIAEKLKISDGTCRVRLSRLRKKIYDRVRDASAK